MAQGLRAIAVEPLLRAMLATGVTAGLAGGIIGALYDLYLARELGFSPAVIGLTIGVGGISALLGALVAQPLVARFGLGPTMVLAATASGAAAALLPLARGPLALPLILLSQASDASYAVYFILATTLRQSITPNRLLGRVGAGFDLLPLGALLLGTLLAAALSDMFGLRAAIAIGAAGVFVANAWLWFSPLPRLRSAFLTTPYNLTHISYLFIFFHFHHSIFFILTFHNHYLHDRSTLPLATLAILTRLTAIAVFNRLSLGCCGLL